LKACRMKSSHPLPSEPERILIIQTAFPGDVILTIPMAQAIKTAFPLSRTDMLVTPLAASLLSGNPWLNEVLEFDKKGMDSGIGGLLSVAGKLKSREYGLALIPHRSLRSAALAALAGISVRIGFHKSAGRFLLTQVVHYEHGAHEVDRNLSLLNILLPEIKEPNFPWLYPSENDRLRVEEFLTSHGMTEPAKLIGVAPGTVWNTKRWPEERFAELCYMFASDGFEVLLIGGREDAKLCARISNAVSSVRSAAGEFSFLESAEAIRRCRLLVSNDSAPMHVARAVETPVLAIFGATVPEFGFSPYGSGNRVMEVKGLKCRPCSIHGGKKCPITTFQCMLNITPGDVYGAARQMMDEGV